MTARPPRSLAATFWRWTTRAAIALTCVYLLAVATACTYPDGAKVFCVAVVELKGGKIAQQTLVQAWDE